MTLPFFAISGGRMMLFALAAGFLFTAAPAAAQQSQWFGCRSGYTLETTTNNRARCVKEQRVQPDAACPLTFTRDVDKRPGNVDVCLVNTPILPGDRRTEHATKCGPGQTVERRPGVDRCMSQQIEPVNQPRT